MNTLCKIDNVGGRKCEGKGIKENPAKSIVFRKNFVQRIGSHWILGLLLRYFAVIWRTPVTKSYGIEIFGSDRRDFCQDRRGNGELENPIKEKSVESKLRRTKVLPQSFHDTVKWGSVVKRLESSLAKQKQRPVQKLLKRLLLYVVLVSFIDCLFHLGL